MQGGDSFEKHRIRHTSTGKWSKRRDIAGKGKRNYFKARPGSVDRDELRKESGVEEMKEKTVHALIDGVLLTYLPVFTEAITLPERGAMAAGFAVMVLLAMIKIEELNEKNRTSVRATGPIA